jgi:CDP-diacylglycerol pyrophosphatase
MLLIKRFSGLALLLCAAATPARASDPNALWDIAHGRCVPDLATLHTPLPCATVDVPHGYVILKDIRGATQFLLIPTARVTGIEDPAVLGPSTPGYWQNAWDARNDVIAMANRKLDSSQLSLAINSKYGRTQNQLHIHIDCIAPDVRAALQEHAATITEQWSSFPEKLAGHNYRVRSVRVLNRPGADPFRLVANGLPEARADMASESIFITGATLPDHGEGFYILETRADPATGNRGSAEELQDHNCPYK